MIRLGDALPTKAMNLREAIAYHNEPLSDVDLETLAEFGEDTSHLSTAFGIVQVEIGVYAGAA